MIAFDTDALIEILRGNEEFLARAAAIPVGEQAVPIIVLEEIIRGRLSEIRRAESGRGKLSIDRAYKLFEMSIDDFRRINILPYTAAAEEVYQDWRAQKIRVSTHDLRIAASCAAHSARLISRNRRDFENIPGLDVEFWT